MQAITKRYPGVTALDGVDFALDCGEVVGLIGENGAGKSTLLKILAGAVAPDAGCVVWQGHPVRLRSPRQAQQAGIAVIYQELSLSPNLTVRENMFLGREPRRWGPFIATRTEQHRALAALERIGLDLDPDTPVRRLSVAQRQLVEIAKALSLDACLVVMDEPTSALTPREVARLFTVIRELSAAGIAVIYVSHRLEEVLQVCGRVVALRDGRHAGECSTRGTRQDVLVRLMIGAELVTLFPKTPASIGAPVLTVRDLVVPGLSAPISFEACAGEILGWFGLMGAGRSETMEGVFGARRVVSGQVELSGGSPGPYRTPRHAIRAGIGFVPEDRKERGLVLRMAVDANISLPGLARWSRCGWRNMERERCSVEQGVADLGIRASSIHQPVCYLSGGNQQKVVLAKWLALAPRVLLLDEPTRGIDVHAKSEIFALMGRMARQGMAVVFASSEIEEVLGMSDRVLVFCRGRIAGEVGRADLSEELLLRLASGLDAAQT